MSSDQLLGNGLGQYISWVVSAQDFGQEEVALPHALLDPQLAGRQMPDLPYARPAAYPYGSATVSTYLQGKVQSVLSPWPGLSCPGPLQTL